MEDTACDTLERLALCDLLAELGPDVPTLVPGWTGKDVAAHLVLRESDPLAGPCMVLPGRFRRVADRRMANLVDERELGWLLARLRAGPPPGFFRIGWVRSYPSLNEFFVHQEDVRRANGLGPRDSLGPDLEEALWHNARRGGRFLARRLGGVGLELRNTVTDERFVARRGTPTAALEGAPGELLLFLFGRTGAACVGVSGPPDAVAAVRHTTFGM